MSKELKFKNYKAIKTKTLEQLFLFFSNFAS